MEAYKWPEIPDNPQRDIDDFIAAVRATLKYWLTLHTNGVAWAEESFLDYNDLNQWLQDCTKDGVIENDYFHTDVKAAALENMAREAIENNEIELCSNCGAMLFDGEYCYNCEDEGQEWESENATMEELNDVLCFYEDTQAQLSDSHIYDAMVGPCFNDYRDGIKGVTGGIEDEIEEILAAYEELGDDRQNWVLWALNALGVWHVNGNIIEDYGDRFNLDYNFAVSVRDCGFADSFGEDELLEWLDS